MSNIPDKDACIVVGIDDNFNIIGTNGNLRQNDIQNIFSNLNFNGGIRPNFYVTRIEVKGKLLDVVVIEHSRSGPIIPASDYPNYKMKSNVIYSRYGEDNEEAKFQTMESLWWERFGSRTLTATTLQIYVDLQKSYFELTVITGQAITIQNIEALKSYKEKLQNALINFRVNCDNPIVSSDSTIKSSLQSAFKCVGGIDAEITAYSQNMNLPESMISIQKFHDELMMDYDNLKNYIAKKVKAFSSP